MLDLVDAIVMAYQERGGLFLEDLLSQKNEEGFELRGQHLKKMSNFICQMGMCDEFFPAEVSCGRHGSSPFRVFRDEQKGGN